MFEDDSLFSACLEQPLNNGWQKSGSDWTLLFDETPLAQIENRPYLILESTPAPTEVYLNSHCLGRMQPFLPYRYEITQLLKPKQNTLVLQFLPDGPSRPPQNAYIDYKKQNVILNAAFSGTPHPDRHADCTVEIETDLKDDGLHVQLFLMDPLGHIVHDANLAAQPQLSYSFSFPSPMLWSPDNPQLYSLNISLEKNGLLYDMYSHGKSGKVGFKRFTKAESGLLLNGSPFLTKSVHLPSDLLELDLSSLKESGVNLVYCAHPTFALLEAADETGILVSALPHPQDAHILNSRNHVSLLT